MFVDKWINRDKTLLYYDWMVRDFFNYMLSNLSNRGWIRPAGNPNQILLGDNWQSKARTAYDGALKACDYERADDGYDASVEWRKIFGSQFPLDISSLAALYGAQS